METQTIHPDCVTHFKRIFDSGLYQYSPKDIASIREKLGKSIADFAKMFSVDNSTIIKWESGDRIPLGSPMRLMQFVEVMANEKHSNINHRIRQAYKRKYEKA